MNFGIARCTGKQRARTDLPESNLKVQVQPATVPAARRSGRAADRLPWPRAVLIIATVSLVVWAGIWVTGAWLLGY